MSEPDEVRETVPVAGAGPLETRRDGTDWNGEDDGEGLFYLSVGPLAAILLGMLLVPLRGFTTASNFTFAFLALTIVVAELGGRGAAVATALTSALSLDFFLTQPYLRLSIDDRHDVIAFLGLAVCGLIAAALGAPRRARSVALARARDQLALFRRVLDQLDRDEPLEFRLREVLAALVTLPLAAAVVRDRRDGVLAAAGPDAAMRPLPDQVLRADDVSPRAGRRLSRSSLPLPAQGARLPLAIGGRQVGWLDVWGHAAPASAEARRVLVDVARLLSVLLAQADRQVTSQG
jgi:K+-sensing histidine kinase KdpD